MEESEFGKGLIICLVKFAEHRWRWQEDKQLYEEMHQKHPDLFDISHSVEMHFNGASDHLYEIEVPDKWKDTEIGKLIMELKSFGLEMGHGFFKHKRKWTEEDVDKAYNMCQQIAILVDKELGLEPEIGQW